MDEKRTVLVVEDIPEVAEVTCDVLESAGFRAVYRGSVTEALDYVARHADTLVGVLTDIYLTEPMSGIELAIHLAQEWPHLELCVTSGQTVERPKRLPDQAGFLPKPWNPKDLVAFFGSPAAAPG